MLFNIVRLVPRAAWIAAVVVALSSSLAFTAPNDATITVHVDQAKLVKFPPDIATIIVGNPLIADVTLQGGGLVIVTGKGYGATNVVAMNRGGTVVLDQQIEVGGPTDRVVTMYRGVERESYSCTPICQRRVTLGDNDSYFKQTMGQAGALTGQVQDSVNAKIQ